MQGKVETPQGDSKEAVQEEPKSRRPRRTKEEIYNFEDLPKVIVGETLPEEVQANPDLYERIGEDYHDELDYSPGQVQVARTVIPKFRKKAEKHQAPVQAVAPLSAIAGAMITPAFAVQLILDKHCDHLTHYRISQRLKREYGFELSDRTINKWVHLVAESLTPIAEATREELFQAKVLQMDETPLKYLEPGTGQAQQGYLWVMRDPKTQTCYYHWATGRSNQMLKEALGYDPITGTLGYRGTIQCDGYRCYESIQKAFEGVKLGGCLAHIRRYFVKDPLLAQEPWVKEVLKRIQRLYQIERNLKEANAPPDQVIEGRQSEAKPITKELHQIFITQLNQHRPKSSAGVALSYALGQWEKWLEYLNIPELEIDNNGVERVIRPTKIGSKNFLFFGSAEAGHNNAVLYTLIENCKSRGINPRVYLEYAIKSLNDKEPRELTPHVAQSMLEGELSQVV